MGDIRDPGQEWEDDFIGELEQYRDEKLLTPGNILWSSYEHNQLMWKQKNGDEINVNDMSNTHLDNTIKMLMRQAKMKETTLLWIGILLTEQNLRKHKTN